MGKWNPKKTWWTGLKISGLVRHEIYSFRCTQCGHLESTLTKCPKVSEGPLVLRVITDRDFSLRVCTSGVQRPSEHRPHLGGCPWHRVG